MKKVKMLVLLLFAIMCCSCSTSSRLSNNVRKVFDYKNLSFKDRCLQHKTNRAIRKAMMKSDTIYIYGVAFNNWKVLWYHREKYINSCMIFPNKIRWQKPIEADNFSVDSASIRKYFEITFYRDIECFEDALDGESVFMIINGKKSGCSVNTECLFSNEFPVGSFPRKLQYDLSKVLFNNNSINKIR